MVQSTFNFVLLSLLAVANGEGTQKSLRGYAQVKGVARISSGLGKCLPCNVGFADVQFQQGYIVDHGEYLVCETDPEDDPEGRANMVYSLDDLPDDFREQYKGSLESGKSRICIPSGKVNRQSQKIEFSKGAASPKYLGEPKNDNGNRRRDLLATIGTRTVLAVIVTSTFNESDPLVNSSIVASNLFGIGPTTPDASLASQYQSCSNGKLNMVPATGLNVTNGVLNIQISTKIAGNTTSILENIIVAATLSALKITDIRSAANHVLLCLPYGSLTSNTPNWVSYGYTNAVKSVHNAGFCAQISAPMHELGHNIGFYHSGNLSTKDEYGDKSGYMGVSYKQTLGHPQMCFNAQKNYFSGWFDDRKISVNTTNGPWIGALLPPVDYAAAAGTMLGAYSVVNVGSLYFQLNSAKSYNYQTMLNKNVVNVVVSDIAGTTATKSWLLAGLGSNQSYTYSNFTGTVGLTIKVCNITFGLIDTAYVSVNLNTPGQSPLC